MTVSDRDREEMLADNLDRFIAGMEEKFKELGLDSKGADLDGSYRLEVSADGIEARADFFPPVGAGRPLDWLSVVEELSSQGLKGLLTEAIAQAVDLCNQGEVQKGVLVAKGIQPVPPKEGKVEILFPLDMGVEMEEVEEDSKVPLHLRKVVRVRTVKPGERLAVFHPPVPGRAGQDVWGNPIEVASPKEVHLLPGKGVALGEDQRTFIAKEEGQPVLDGVVLRVDPVFEVRGDVGVSTGNVRFDGSIVVRGNVSSGFSVEAGIDVEIFGGVFDATVRCGRDAVLHGGLVGPNSKVEAGGAVVVHHVEMGTVEADGSVNVERYSLNGRIMAGDSVTVKGRQGVIGGLIQALNRLDLTSAGSAMGAKTFLSAGSSFRIRRQISNQQEALKEVVGAILRMENFVKALVPKGGELSDIREDLRDRLKKALLLYDSLKKQERDIKARLEVLRGMLESSSTNGVIKVRGEVHPGVTVEIRGVKREIFQAMRYVSFYVGDDCEITFGPYS